MPAPVLAVMTADWHMDRRPWARHPSAEGDSLYALNQIVDIAREFDVDLIGAGDLFDTVDPDSYVVSQTLDSLNRLPREVLYVQGQHEKSDPPWLSLCPKATNLHRRRAILRAHTGEHVHVYGLDYCPSLKDELEQNPLPANIDLLVTHQVWKELMQRSAGSTASVRDLPPHVRTVFTGDYHKHLAETFARGQNEAPVTLWSPGSTHCRSSNEPAEKYVYLLRADMTVESRPLDGRPVRYWAIPSTAALDALVATSNHDLFGPVLPTRPSSVVAPVVSIAVTSDVPAAAETLNARFADCHLFVHLTDRATAESEELPLATVADTTTLVSACLDEMAIDPDVRSDARDLLRPEANAGAVLDAICRRFDADAKEKGSIQS